MPWRSRLAAVAALLAVGPAVTACSGGAGRPAATSAAPAPAAVAPTSAAPPAPVEAPAAGTQLVSVTLQGRINPIPGVHGFDIVDSVRVLNTTEDDSTVTTYDAAGHKLTVIPSGEFTGECGALDVAPASRRLVITALDDQQPAQGINPQLESFALTAWDATTGAKVWSTTVLQPQTDPVAGCQAYDGVLDNFAATLDGTWGVLGGLTNDQNAPVAVNLATGALQKKPDILGVVGNYIATGTADKPTLVTPTTWAPAGTVATVPSNTVDLVARGVLSTAGSGPILSADGKTYIAREGDTVKGYTLPGLTAAWQHPVGDGDDQLVAAGAGLVLLARKEADNTTLRLNAVDAATGRDLWTIPDAEVCGMTSTQMLVGVNEQLAVIDLTTGKQISYGPATDLIHNDACPRVLAGGIKDTENGQTVTVTQILAP